MNWVAFIAFLSGAGVVYVVMILAGVAREAEVQARIGSYKLALIKADEIARQRGEPGLCDYIDHEGRARQSEWMRLLICESDD